MLRKACVRLSIMTYSSLENFLNMDIFELGEIADEVKEAMTRK